MKKNLKIFSGTSNYELAKKIADKLDLPLESANIIRFSDGEVYTKINNTVRGAEIFIVQPTSYPVNETLMELLIFIDALKRASAKSIVAVVPYYGYARQDRKASPREPITSKLIADLLSTAGATRLISMDLHADQIQGFFNIPVDHFRAIPILANYFIKKVLYGDKLVIVAPDVGSVKRARSLANWLDCKIAIIDKRRPKPNTSEIMNVIGEVKDKTAILVDDIIDTAGTITQGAKAIHDLGAKEIYACCTHPVLSGKAVERIEDSPIKELIVTDTICLPEEKRISKIKVISVDGLLAEGIRRVYENRSINDLFIEKKIKVENK